MAQVNSYYDYLQQHNALVADDRKLDRDLNATQQQLADPSLTADQKDGLQQRGQMLQGEQQQVKAETQGLEQTYPQYEEQRSGKAQDLQQQAQRDKTPWKDRLTNTRDAIRDTGVVVALSVGGLVATPLPDQIQDKTVVSAPDYSHDFKDKLKDLAEAVKDDIDKRKDLKQGMDQAQQAHQVNRDTPDLAGGAAQPQQSPYQYADVQVTYQPMVNQADKTAQEPKASLNDLLDKHQENFRDACFNEAKGDGKIAADMANDKLLQTLDKQAGQQHNLSEMDPAEKKQLMANHLSAQYGKDGEDAFSKLNESDQKKEQQLQQQRDQQNQQQMTR